MPRVLSLFVVGADYPNKDGGNRRSEIMFCNPGEFIELRPEPRNPADPYAVAVLSARGFQIGYLTAEKAPWIGSFIRQEREVRAVFQGTASCGAIIRVGIDGAIPTLPLEAAARETEGTDWPEGIDWIPPDE